MKTKYGYKFRRPGINGKDIRIKKVMPTMMAPFSAASLEPADLEAESILLRRWQVDRDQDAKERLIRHNLKFAATIAADFVGAGVEEDDLMQEAAIGLSIAADRFDRSTGYKFISYAVWWVLQRVQREVDTTGRFVRMPIHSRRLMGKIERARRELMAHGASPTPKELAAATGISLRQVTYLEDANVTTVSMSQSLGSQFDDLTVADVLESPGPSPEDELAEIEMREVIDRALGLLSQRERQIITARFGLDGNEVRSLEDIGAEMHVSRERVRQLQKRALEKMGTAKEFAFLSELNLA